tara:strand:+ start:138 stop:434 length:297 start_codon:yes stop_codon:yes gene_type:complete
MKITKEVIVEMIKEQLQEAFGMEQDFKPGMKVNWSSLEKITRKTASGREKVDYVRMPMEGEIVKVEMDRYSAEPGFAMVAVDGEREPVMVALTELDPA